VFILIIIIGLPSTSDCILIPVSLTRSVSLLVFDCTIPYSETITWYGNGIYMGKLNSSDLETTIYNTTANSSYGVTSLLRQRNQTLTSMLAMIVPPGTPMKVTCSSNNGHSIKATPRNI